MNRTLFLLLIASTLLFSATIKQFDSGSKQKTIELTKEQKELEKENFKKENVSLYLSDLKTIEAKIANKNSVWIKSRDSYLTSLEVSKNLEKVKEKISYLQRKPDKSLDEIDELNTLVSKRSILISQTSELKKKDGSPFSNLLTPPIIEKAQPITNPIDIFTGISHIKALEKNFDDYELKKKELSEIIALLKSEMQIYKEIEKLDPENKFLSDIKNKNKQLEQFEIAIDTMVVASEVYRQRLDIVEIEVDKSIDAQIIKLVKIGITVLVIFVIFFLLKLFIKKYITDNDRFYMANKVITFINFTLIILIVFFSYIENAGYLVTILGFASAGIAIAMKDWFMSILGWLVIVFGGSIRVGDRIRVDMDGMQYIGDVMDISLLRMTILEDVTLTSIMKNRRAGRIIFVPNNYIFTRMVANYTHGSLKTVWDGVQITITFDSNHKKAMHLCREITKKYAKGYTDITRKQLGKLRSEYSLKNTNVEPRIFSFIEPNGISIDSWYLTNAYGTLVLRSTISTEIIDAFNKEDDIIIAYPTQKINIEGSETRALFTEFGDVQ
ncbi:mechanosensitive ion channel domain-containing protein [Sulfurimonas sp.]|uniref:mechanosensitive ion channel domain-containing protein n=1 Tax=Sulfurimonas sp. TaxID=2022749 RepID=UPI0025FB68B3|nr:mechanosensitive ion channel domain-containing protein [Sulfurimonas sp.]MDD5157022.1 mechanosensitive ion channel [Sulfurimonas sp.]